ncbi:MAG: hypothetical protein LLG37_00800 [Spirochaetia bacterium]|nr:hypothetical protein [Spirochaetia bacterium]
MLKKIALVLAVILAPVMLFAGTINKDHWTYKDIKSLVDAGIISKPLTADSLTREEVVEYINDGVYNVLAAKKAEPTGTSSDAELMAMIDKLYNLVKAYMTDMTKSQQKLDSILETIGDLKVKKENIEKRQDRLLNAMGMRINGESSAYMTDVLKYGSSYITAGAPGQRYRPITQYLDLKFSLRATKEMYAEATLRLENLYGGFWGSGDIYGLRRFFIQGDYPVAFVIGDFQGKLTPYTLWAVDDERPFESRLFSDKRDMNKNELYLLDNTWPLSGAKVQTIIELFDTIDVDAILMGARLGEADKNNYQAYDTASDIFIPSVYKHDQYLVAGRIASSFQDIVKLGFNMTEIMDAKDTGTWAAESHNMDNFVWSGDVKASLKFGDGMEAGLNGEFAKSDYTNNKWYANYISDTALHIEAGAKAFGTELSVSYGSTGNSFTAYAAQTRMYDERNNEAYLTQNSTWNIANKPPSYAIGGKMYPFTRYNPCVNVAYGNGSTAATGLAVVPGNLLFYPQYENNALPYGDSTPNRQAIQVGLSGNYMDGLVQPGFKYVMANELVSYENPGSPRKFTVIEAGVRSKFMMFDLTLGFKSEDTTNDLPDSVDYVSSTFDFGINAEVIKKKMNVFAGYKNTAFNGHEYQILGGGYALVTNQDVNISSMGLGFDYKIAKPAVIGMAFTNTLLENLKDKTNSYNVQELDVKVSINF